MEKMGYYSPFELLFISENRNFWLTGRVTNKHGFAMNLFCQEMSCNLAEEGRTYDAIICRKTTTQHIQDVAAAHAQFSLLLSNTASHLCLPQKTSICGFKNSGLSNVHWLWYANLPLGCCAFACHSLIVHHTLACHIHHPAWMTVHCPNQMSQRPLKTSSSGTAESTCSNQGRLNKASSSLHYQKTVDFQ